MGEVWTLMDEAGIKPDMQTYAASFEGIGRHKKPIPLAVEKIIEKMEAQVSLICLWVQ